MVAIISRITVQVIVYDRDCEFTIGAYGNKREGRIQREGDVDPLALYLAMTLFFFILAVIPFLASHVSFT